MKHEWPHWLIRPTRQYAGGILSGCGVGILAGRALTVGTNGGIPPLPMIIALLLVCIGSRIAQVGQRTTQTSKDSEQPDAEVQSEGAPSD